MAYSYTSRLRKPRNYEYVRKCKKTAIAVITTVCCCAYIGLGKRTTFEPWNWVLKLSYVSVMEELCLVFYCCIASHPQVQWRREIFLASSSANWAGFSWVILPLVSPHSVSRLGEGQAQLGCWNCWVFPLFSLRAPLCDLSFSMWPLHKLFPIE